MLIKEACVESVLGAIHAQERGADRIELCDDLGSGGITPSFASIESAKRILKIPIMVMIRPRAGNFTYDTSELKIMRQAIGMCKSIGVHGIVTGALTRENEIDVDITSELVQYALPMQVTFHKAIDATPDIFAAFHQLMTIRGITRVLTSGGAVTAMKGAPTLNKLIELANSSIVIIAAGKITDENIVELSEIIHTSEFHGRRIVGVL
jgi:copper homeostasis protein